MSEHIRDAIISIPSSQSAQLESWLLGHGFLADHSSNSADGELKFYAVKQISADGRSQIAEIGGQVVSQWKHGEAQASSSL